MIDDYNRAGERRTVRDIKKVLDKNRIPYAEGSYPGLSHVCVIVSKKDQFLCTL